MEFQRNDHPPRPVQSPHPPVWVAASSPASVDRVDRNNWNAMVQLHEHLRRLGVVAAVEEAGIKPGDTIKVGKLEWEWE